MPTTDNLWQFILPAFSVVGGGTNFSKARYRAKLLNFDFVDIKVEYNCIML